MKIDMIAFDADDTLWDNEVLYQNAQEGLKEILSPWGNPEVIDKALYETEMRNLPLYGYGIKAFSLSMIETAIQISKGEIHGIKILKILDIAQSMLQAEVKLRPYVRETLETLSQDYPLMVITKGDLLDQISKIKRSGLEGYFSITEVINDKTLETYRAILQRHDLLPERFLMVGNSLRSDVLPVLALGGKAVYVPAETTWKHEVVSEFDGHSEYFFELEHLGLLPGLVEGD
jgi:putative hydrolase of the HAD superfamily